jgi:hypothetical protein
MAGAEGERPQKRGSGFLRLFERGVDTATRNNVTACGYSVSITAAFAFLQTSRSDTGVSEIFVFAAGAVVAFAVIACLASGFFREELEDQPSNVKSLAGALSFFSVGLALGVAYVVGILARRFGGVAGELLLNDDRLYSVGRDRASGGTPDIGKPEVTASLQE